MRTRPNGVVKGNSPKCGKCPLRNEKGAVLTWSNGLPRH